MSEHDDYGESEIPAILEPENLFPLMVMTLVGAILAVPILFAWKF